MGRTKKKRTKRYSGVDAKQTTARVIRVSAEERGPVKDWWVMHRVQVKIAGAIAGVVSVLSLIGVGIAGLF